MSRDLEGASRKPRAASGEPQGASPGSRPEARGPGREGAGLPPLQMLLVVLFVAVAAVRAPGYDVWLHLASGRYIWQTGAIPVTDPFSHTALGAPWIYHEWLAALFSYGLHGLGGLRTLALWQALTFGAVLLLLLRVYTLRGGTAGAVPVVLLMADLVLLGNVVLARPHLFTLLFMAVFLYFLERARQEDRALPLWLPLIMALWANVHGGWILGFVLMGVHLLGDGVSALFVERVPVRELLRPATRPAPLPASARRLRRLVLLTALCLAAVLANPYGLENLLYPLQFVQDRPFLRQIEEWAPPNFQRQVPLEAVMLGCLGVLLLARRRVSLTDGLLALVAAYFSLTASRNTFLLALFVTPALVPLLEDLHRGPIPGPARRLCTAMARMEGRRIPAAVLAVAVSTVGVLRLAAPLVRSPEENPAEAVAYLKKARPPGRLFNDYESGGYLLFHLWPDYPVYVDGRAEVYAKTPAFDRFLRVWNLHRDWSRILREDRVNTVLVDRRQSLAGLLDASPEWERVHVDERSAVFVRR